MEGELKRDELLARLNKAEAFIAREGYRTCSAAACNCGSWHGGSWYRRYEEIHEVAIEAGVKTNGVLLVDAIRDALNTRAAPAPVEPSEAIIEKLKVAEHALLISRHRLAAEANGDYTVTADEGLSAVRAALAALRAAKEKDNG